MIAGELTCLPSYPTNVPQDRGFKSSGAGGGGAARVPQSAREGAFAQLSEVMNPGSKLIGFEGGPEGLCQGRCKELRSQEADGSAF